MHAIEQPVSTLWMLRGHAVLGSLVVTVGLWLMWGAFSSLIAAILAISVTGFLVWRGTTLGKVWAWTTLLLGGESLAWPMLTMIRILGDTTEPTDPQIGEIGTSLLFGLFSSIFWLTFAYGIFRRSTEGRQAVSEGGASAAQNPRVPSRTGGKKKKKRQERKSGVQE